MMNNNYFKFDDRERTQEENLFFTEIKPKPRDSWNEEAEIKRIVSDIQTCPDPYEQFIRGVEQRLDELGYSIDIESIIKSESIDQSKSLKKMRSIIRQKYKDKYSTKYDENKFRTVRNWINGCNLPQGNDDRENLYRFCMILDMDLQMTAEFFYKHFLTIPFNFKNKVDAVFYYCLLNNKGLSIAEQLLERSSSVNVNTSNKNDIATIDIRKKIDQSNDEQFLNYISTYCFGKETWFTSAKIIVEKIFLENVKLAESTSHDAMLKEIYGMNNQYEVSDISNVQSLPQAFRKSLPKSMEISKILNEKNSQKITYDMVRKAIVILNFYNFYKNAYKNISEDIPNSLIDSLRKEFRKNTDEMLVGVGLTPLYPFNPFDWIMLYCANSDYPLDTFKLLFYD